MKLSVLVVDDSEVMRRVVRRALAFAQIPVGEVHEAGNGQEALAVIGEHWIDVVFADLNMPTMGVEIAEDSP